MPSMHSKFGGKELRVSALSLHTPTVIKNKDTLSHVPSWLDLFVPTLLIFLI